jgi:cell fate regulator YaaT (PSP1 superfamily)
MSVRARAAGPAALVEFHPLKVEPCVVPEGMELEAGEVVIVQDDEGEDSGLVVDMSDADDAQHRILRRASAEDLVRRQELEQESERAASMFNRLKDELNVELRVVGAHWRLDRRKVYLYFASESRIDARSLHRAVAAAMGARVALRQVGVRDYARLLGGLGSCGREVCCRRFIRELKPIALRMARQQSLFVESGKISGLCGKLLCCLSFEDEAYQQWLKEMPRVGDTVLTDGGSGVVVGVDMAKRRVNVRDASGTELTVALEELGRRH